MVDDIRGLPADEPRSWQQERGATGGDEPVRAAPEAAQSIEEQQQARETALPPGWEELFSDFPRPAERRAKEFLPQWLRRLGRG